MATDLELYRKYPFNRDNYLKFMAIWLELEFAGAVTVEETDLLLAYNHDNYLQLIHDANAAGAAPPEAIEPEITAVWTSGVPITPIDFSTNFTGFVVSYSMTVVPTGLTFNTETGVLSGTTNFFGGGRPGVIAHGREHDAACVLDYISEAP